MSIEKEIETTPRWHNAQRLLTQNIINAFKLALGIHVPLAKLPVMWWQCVVFPFLSLLALFLQSYVAIGVDGEFNRWALPSVLYPITISLIAAIATAYAARQPEKSLAAFQLLLMMAFAIDAFA